MNRFARLFIPKHCLACGRVTDPETDGFCDICGKLVARLDGETETLPCLDGLQTVFSYSGAVAEVLKRFKSEENREAAEWFAEKLAEKLNPEEFDVIVFVPRAVAGYNQSRSLAKALSKRLRKPLVEALIKRPGVKSQTKCRNFSERLENVRYAYRPKHNVSLSGQRALIVDDVYTSGATLDRCGHALRKLGAVKVYGISVAHRSRNRAKNIQFELRLNPAAIEREYTLTREQLLRSEERYRDFRRKMRLKDFIRREFTEEDEEM